MGKFLFLSAIAYVAYRYISKSNSKAKQLDAAPGTVEVLGPDVKAGATAAVDAGHLLEAPGERRRSPAEEQ